MASTLYTQLAKQGLTNSFVEYNDYLESEKTVFNYYCSSFTCAGKKPMAFKFTSYEHHDTCPTCFKLLFAKKRRKNAVM